MGVAALILGIISVVFCWWNWIGIIPGVIGVILGAIAKKKNANCAGAGLVLSIIGLALSTILYIACVACAVAGGLM